MKTLHRGASRFVCLGFLLLAGAGARAFLAPAGTELPNFDRRTGGAEAATAAGRGAGLAALRARLPDARVDFDEHTGAPKWIVAGHGFLSGPDGQGRGIGPAAARAFGAGEEHRATKAFLREHEALFGFGPAALAKARVKQDAVTAHNGLRSVVWEQELDGIPVFQGLLIAHTTRSNELVNLSSHFVPNLDQAAARGTPNRVAQVKQPPVAARRAVALAGQNLGETLGEAEVDETGNGPAGAEQRQSFRAPPLNGEAVVKLVWLPLSQDSLRLSWEVVLTSRARGEMYRLVIDAQTGEVMVRHCLTEYLSDASYRVFTSDSPSPFSPSCPTPCTTQPPIVSRTLVTLSALDTNASPAGWIDDGGNETRGNNTDAHADRDANDIADLPRPQGSPLRTFDFTMDLAQAPSTYTNAAVTDLFYWCNWMHDKLYALGFTEAGRNFQSNNFGRGGLGNDALQADAQDGSGFNNANMSTPSDGSPPRMQMYVFSGPTPDRDGDLDHEIVLHEYTHGLSNRRVGGGAGLSALQSRGLGEGWSDWYGLALLSEPGDDVNGVYAAGAYATYQLSGMTSNYYFGIRRYPYSTDLTKNPLTFKDIDPAQASTHPGVPRSSIIGNTADEVHNQGEVWCMVLWEARANLIARYGFVTGNQLSLQLVTDGMNLSPANPNFVQSRDAILQADIVANGGADLPVLWAAFAKRGMGYSATSPSSSTTVGLVEAYDVPDNLSILPMSLAASGPVGGPFTPNPVSFVVTNLGSSNINWSVNYTATWLSVAPTSGSLSPGGPSTTVQVTFGPTAATLPLGTHIATLSFSNQNTTAVQARPVTLGVVGRTMSDDFDPGLDLSQWSTFGGTVGSTVMANSYGSYVSPPNSLWFGDASTRHATTIAVDTSGGGAIGFSIRLANGTSTTWETVDALPTEGVVLEASTNNGTTWNLLGSYDTTAYYNWTTVTSTIPAAARSAATRFRWRQKSHSGSTFDHWAIDSVSIDATPAAVLSLSLPPLATEGDAPAGATVTASPAPTNNLIVTLASSDPTEVTMPATVIILAGQSNAIFDLTIINDTELDGNQSANLTATAGGYAGTSATLIVQDDETANLALNLPVSVTEGGGTIPAGLVTVDAAPAANIPVSLSSGDTTEIQVPASVLLPAGQTSVVFNVTIVNDSEIDGAQAATITAHVANWTDGVGVITVLDDEPTNLLVTLPASAREGDGTLAGAGSVRISGTLTTNLSVALLSSDLTELTVPPIATILAGATIAAFNLTIEDDPDIDSSQNVTVTASAAGFASGATNMVVTDDESPPEPFNPSPAHLAADVVQTSDLSWLSGAVPGEIITNEVYLGTNPAPGPAELLGSTTSTNWTLPTLFPATTYYWQIVARKTGVTPGPVWQFTTRGVDHFAWSPVPGTQYVSQPFPVTVTAKDAFEVTVTNFAGPVSLSAWQDGAGGGPQTVQVLSFTTYADVSLNGEYRNVLRAVSNYFPTFVESATTATSAAALQAALAGKHVFLIPEQELAPSGTLGPLGTAWAPVLSNFVSQGGLVIACSFQAEEHLILANSGLMNLTKGLTASSQLIVRTADHFVTQGVSNSFTGGYISEFTSNNGLPVMRSATASNAVVLVRDFGAGHVVMIGSDFYTPATGMDRVAANAVRWAQGGGGSPIALGPTNSGGFVDGAWSGDVTVLQPATNVVLRAADGAGHTGQSNPMNIELRNDLAVSLNDTPDPVSLGGNLTCIVTVTNRGPAAASGVVVTNLLSAGLSLVYVNPSQGTVTTNGNLIVCALGTLTGDSAATITLVATATNIGTLTNQAFVARGEPDAYLPNNSAMATTAVQTPAIAINDVSVYESGLDLLAANFTVSISPAPALAASVNFATVPGTAVSPGDFLATNGVVNFAPGETNQTISVQVVADALYELNENFSVNLSGAVNATLGDSSGLGTILNDEPMPTLSIGDATLREGHSGVTNAVFTVTLSGASGLPTTAYYATANGNATSGSDYTARSGFFSLPAGSTSTNLTVAINGDLQIETDEVFYLDLSSVGNALLLKREGVGWIVNDDGLPGDLDHFVWNAIPSPQWVGEPFGVTLTALDAFNQPATNFTGPASLGAVVGGGAITNTILGNPVYSFSGNYGTFTLGYSFTPNTNLTVTHVRSYSGTKVSLWSETGVLLVAQTVSSIPGTWVDTPLATPLALSAGTTYRVGFYSAGATYYSRYDLGNTFAHGTINQSYEISGDAFPTSADSERWWLVDLRYTAGNSVPASITPVVTGNFTNGSWSGDVTALGLATNLGLTANDGQGHTGLSASFSVGLRNDVALQMTGTPGPVGVFGNVTYALTITNVGPAAATGVVVTNRLPPDATLVSVTASQGGTLTNGGVLIAELGTLAGNSAATINLVVQPTVPGTITNAATVYRNEADPLAGNNSAQAVTLVEMPVLTIDNVSVFEGNAGVTQAVFTVTATPPPATNVWVNFVTVNGTAQAGTDYFATNGLLTFGAGQSNQTIAVQVLGDTTTEPSETFFVVLAVVTNATPGTTLGTGTIVNDEVYGHVAIFGAPGTDSWNEDVRQKISAAGSFAQVDAFLIKSGYPVPTLAQLQQYAAVLVFSDAAFNDGTALGNVLADYVDNGGGVVLCTFAYGGYLQGRLVSGGYLPFATGGQDQPGNLTLVADLPAHEILAGVVSFNGGTGSYHNTGALNLNAVQVAHWNNNRPLVGTKETAGHRVAGLNFYPPSSSVRSDFWKTNTQGGLLMANALSWAANAGPNTNPPVILAQPVNQSVLAGGSASFDVAAAGAVPLSYQWRKGGSDLAGATSASFGIPVVQTNDAGSYAVVITNLYGAVTSAPAVLTVGTLPPGPDFVIVSLLTNNSYVVDHNAQTGDDRGGIAASDVTLLYSGDNSTARFNLTNLSGGTALGAVYDALVSDLQSGRIYSLANGTTPLTYSGGTVTTLLEHNRTTGVPAATTITLSNPISLPANSGNVGIFAGYGRVVLHTGSRVYDIALPSGVVTDLGPMAAPAHAYTENWAYWGVAEYSGGVIRLVYVRDAQTIVRRTVPTGATTTLASFTSLSDMACITVSIPLNRWFFHYEGTSQFGGSSETVGYADAVFNLVPATNPPVIVTQPASQAVPVGGTATFTVLASGTSPLLYQWHKQGISLAGATDSAYTITNVQMAHAGDYSVVVSNAYGATLSSNATLTVPTAQSFNYTGAEQTFVVPAGVTSLQVECWGAQGSAGASSAGGLGGYVRANVAVTPGELVAVYVGQLGPFTDITNGGYSANAFNGGGRGWTWNGNYGYAGSGGGASDVRLGGNGLNHRVLVAGGGGGATGNSCAGGAGGGLSAPTVNCGFGDVTGGSQIAGGTGGQNGTFGQGGMALSPTTDGWVGGGGGGYYGGGCGFSHGSGAGGSSYTGGYGPYVTSATTNVTGARSGPGQVMITWQAPTLAPALRFLAPQLSGGQLNLRVATVDGSPIPPARASNLWVYAATNLALPLSNWTAVASAPVLSNGVLVVNGINPANPPVQFFRAIEGPWNVQPLRLEYVPRANGVPQLRAGNADGRPLTPIRATRISFLAATDANLALAAWTPLGVTPQLSNGMLTVSSPLLTNAPARFFRAVENP